MKDGRKLFFTGLLVALLIVTNIVAVKVTVIAQLPLSCSIFVYPFTFLCIAIISDLYGAKSAIKSVCFAVLAQVLLTIVGTIIVNLPNQVSTIVEANTLQQLIAPELKNGIYMPNMKVLGLIFFGGIVLSIIGYFIFQKLQKRFAEEL